MPLHDKAPWEYAGHKDCEKGKGPELRPVPEPVPHSPAALKSKRPARQPQARTALGSPRGYRRLGGL
jgi:hypothetical protein